MKLLLAGAAIVGCLFLSSPALAQMKTVEGVVTTVTDGMIKGGVHCPQKTATINTLKLVWPCRAALPPIGSKWRVTYATSHPRGSTLTAREITRLD